MGFFDNVLESTQDAIGKGVSVARDKVSGVALENAGFVRRFVRMCDDGWNQGWHERNGGNASYRLTPDEVASSRSFFADAPSTWIHLGISVPVLAGQYFLVTATGSYMRNVALDPDRAVGIVEIDESGNAYRIVWGMKEGGRPTSEFAGHLLIHQARIEATNGASRVLYHAHPTSIVALSKVLPLDERTFTQKLWRAHTECVMVFPEGVGVVGCQVPGSLELARASAEQMARHAAVVWAHHGLLCAGDDFDDTFGRMHVIVKAAEIYTQARLLQGSDVFANDIANDELRAIAQGLGVTLNEDMLTPAQ